jgi:hypothetical protein
VRAISPVLYSAIEPMGGKSPNIPAATNSRLRTKIPFVSPKSVSPVYVEGDGHCNWAQIASEWDRRGRFLFRSILYFGATPIINVLFFPSEVE